MSAFTETLLARRAAIDKNFFSHGFVPDNAVEFSQLMENSCNELGMSTTDIARLSDCSEREVEHWRAGEQLPFIGIQIFVYKKLGELAGKCLGEIDSSLYLAASGLEKTPSFMKSPALKSAPGASRAVKTVNDACLSR